MKHVTIDYGIDLGTTNSAICRMEQGVPTIIRSESGMETMPSCISFKKGGTVRVGQAAYDDLGKDKLRALKKRETLKTNSCIEFKRYMGSDMTYSSQYIDHGMTPEELSATVVSTLCSFVTDDQVTAAVITVPAKFTVNQKDATLQAARLAGIKQVELLQEPIAASIAYGLKSEEKNGVWMVFDFGGGTLDVALVHVSDGVMQVFDTEGDNYLGGKNLDEEIVAKIILPELTRHYAFDLTDSDQLRLLVDALKVVAEKLKNRLSYCEKETVILEAGDWGDDEDGEEIELTFDVTRQQVEAVIRPLLQKAVDVCKTLMSRNNITIGQLSHLILIGGPTYIPLLRQMLREQVTPNVETGIDPMTAVAVGAAIYASTIPVKVSEHDSDDDTLQLCVDYEATTVDTTMYVPVIMKNYSDGLRVSMVRRSDGWCSEEAEISEQGGLVVIDLLPDQPNTFRVVAKRHGAEVRCFPSEITIYQGSKAAAAILPYNIGIEVYNPRKDRNVFTAFTGLEKNRPLPATGNVYGLHTMTALNPGQETDKVRIAVYQGDEDAEGKTAALYEYVSDVVITGDDILSYIPSGSHINIRIDVDRSEMMTIVAEFPQTSQRVEKKLDTSRRVAAKDSDNLARQLKSTQEHVKQLSAQVEEPATLRSLAGRLSEIEYNLKNGAQLKQVEQHLKEVLRMVEDYEYASEWDRALYALKQAFIHLQSTAIKHTGETGVNDMLDMYSHKVKLTEETEDTAEAKRLKGEIEDYEYRLEQAEIYRDFIRSTSAYFRYYKWHDEARAHELVLQAEEILNDDPEAPLSKTKNIAEMINALRIRETNNDNQSGKQCPNDIPSM